MRTKHTILWLALAAAVSFSSCEKSGIDGRLRDANLFINLSVGPDTKTTGGDEDPAEDAEKAIKSVRLFLVKYDSSTSAPDASAPVVEIDDIALDSTSVSASVSSTNGNLQLLYVLANCPSTTLTLDLTNYSTFIGSYSLATSNVGKIWDDEDGFVMVNSVDYNSRSDGGVLVDFSGQAVNAGTIYMERLAAKIVADQDRMIDFSAKLQKVYGENDDQGYVISSARIDAWALMNCVNSFNLIQKYTKDTKDFHKNAGGEIPDVIVTPSSNNDYPVAKKSTLKSTGYYYYTNPQYNGLSSGVPTYTELEFVDAGETLYCLENNPSYCPTGSYAKESGTATPAVSDSKMKGRCTAVIFRAQILLADGFDAGADTGSHDGTDPVGTDPNPGQWDSSKGQAPTKSSWNTNIAMTLYSYKGKYYADLTRLKTDYSGLASCADNAALRAAGVKVYEDGYMYYTYYLAKTDITGCYSPYYCVERNKSYRLTVKAVSELGDDLPCDYTHYDPEDPVDMAIPKMTVTADVLPWDVKNPVEYEIQ